MQGPCRCFNSSPEAIRLTAMTYIRYPLALRQVEDLPFERGIEFCRETVRFWRNRFGPIFGEEPYTEKTALPPWPNGANWLPEEPPFCDY